MGMARWKHNFDKFAQLERADKWLFIRAVFWLALVRIVLLVVPFRRLFENQTIESSRGAIDADPEFLRRVSYVVGAAANNVPWGSDCFPQTIAARMLLKRQGYESIIHVGVERVGEDMLNGHAWLTCGDIVVTGGAELHRYTELLAD
jgi:hypothetical protein